MFPPVQGESQIAARFIIYCTAMGLRGILVGISLFLHTKKSQLRIRAAVVTAETPTEQMGAVPSRNRILVVSELLTPEP